MIRPLLCCASFYYSIHHNNNRKFTKKSESKAIWRFFLTFAAITICGKKNMPGIQVVISSVQREFAEERQLLCRYIREDALLGRFFAPFIFEELPAIDLTAQQAYLTEAAQSNIYLGLFGEQYGYEDASGISPTEREYDMASSNHRHRLIFIKQTDSRHVKEEALIAKAEQDVVRKSFSNYEELRSSVYALPMRLCCCSPKTHKSFSSPPK